MTERQGEERDKRATGEIERESERRETQIERHRREEGERQTDSKRPTDGERDRQTGRERERQKKAEMKSKKMLETCIQKKRLKGFPLSVCEDLRYNKTRCVHQTDT